MFKYETHLHTFPVSKCACATVSETLDYYKYLSYDGVFVTNHFLDGNINVESGLPYKERLDFYFSDYENAVKYGQEIGLKVFLGVELSYRGTDFLVYGLDKEWYASHPEIMDMKRSDQLRLFMDNDALVIQAHPYREASYIDHIRLFPRCVHGAEIINACRTDEENEMAKIFAEHYQLIEFAGSDNHRGKGQKKLAGMCCERKITDEKDFVNAVKKGEMKPFCDVYDE